MIRYLSSIYYRKYGYILCFHCKTNVFFCCYLRSQVCKASKGYQMIAGMDKWCQSNCVNYPSVCPEDFCKCPYVFLEMETAFFLPAILRLAIRSFILLLIIFCRTNCWAHGEIEGMPGADEYCQDQCIVYGAKCPKHRCSCS